MVMVTWRLLVQHTGIQRSTVFRPSWKMCPDLDATCGQCSLPSGLGSPSTTLRISATSGSATSRPQRRRTRLPATLAPALKSLTTAAARSTIIGRPRPTGPGEPARHRPRHGSGPLAIGSGLATSGCFSALIVQLMVTTQQQRPGRFDAFGGDHDQGLMVRSIGWSNCSTSSAMVFAFGVSMISIARVGGRRPLWAQIRLGELDIRPHSRPVEKAMASSPESART